ncbi:MAG TPA: ABC transporter ATP-binding protein [Azospirillum sp.]|nr:ABC transporter ATP-binding protein [Azospirillum sp.]
MPESARLSPTRSSDAPGRRLAALVRDVVCSTSRRRLVAVAILMAVAAFAEGAGLMLLVPLLDLLGITGSGRVAGWLTALGLGPVGLEGTLVVYLVLVAVAAWVVRARTLAATELRMAFMDSLRSRLHAALLATEWRTFARLRAGAVQQALTEEVGRTGMGVEFLLRLGAASLEVPALLTVAALVSPLLTGAALGLAVAVAVAMRPLNRRTYQLGQSMQRMGRALHADLAEDLTGMRVVRSHGLEGARRRRFAERAAATRANLLAFQRTSGTERAATRVAAAAATALVVVLAVRGFAVPLADTLVLVVAFARLASAGLVLRDGYRTVLHALPAHAALADLLAQCRAAAEPVGSGAVEPPPFTRTLRLENVAFRHAEGDPPALSGVDVEIPARGVTAVIGPSGAGKSTLADLLLGLLAPDDGRILVDNRPLEGAARQGWRRRVGYVPQDSFLFHDTIRANLAMAAPDAGEPALWQALERAAAADFVRALADGLDTVVGERGSRLSGGERQRLALARALVRCPDLLILDEATSALDAESERHVLAALDRLRHELAVIVVAHRASTVRDADTVIVLERGRVAAAGSWDAVARQAAPLLNRLGMIGDRMPS